MLQVRIHGRGGQGVVTAAELLAIAAFHAGRQSQAFPSFGSERMGAPVVAFCRIDDAPIRLREPVAAPDVLIIQDPTLLGQVNVFAGLSENGTVLINTTNEPGQLALNDMPSGASVRCVPASQIAVEHIGRPLPNAVMLGALSAIGQTITLDGLSVALNEKFPPAIAEKNIAAAKAAEVYLRQASTASA